jgi:hypothetical protein
MKRILVLLTFLALSAFTSGPLMAQGNSFVGTWKLNLAKSKFEPGPAPKSMTRIVEIRGKSANYSFEGIAADGSPVAYSFNTDYDGKDSPVTGTGTPGGADSIAIKRVSKNKAEATLKKEGKLVGRSEAEVSKDGKVTTVKSKGTAADGKEYSSESVYEKQ